MNYEEAVETLQGKPSFGNREHIHAARVISAEEALADKEIMEGGDGRPLCGEHGSTRNDDCVVCREIEADSRLSSARHQLSIYLDRQDAA